MRRKFKKTVTMLASLTISVSQLQTPAMATTIEHNTETISTGKDDVVVSNDAGGTVTTNSGTVEANNSGGTVTINSGTVEANNNGGTVTTNNGTVKNNNSGGTVTTNNGTVENNEEGGTVKDNNLNGVISTNYGRVENNHENAQVEYNFGTIGNNEGVVGKASPGGTVNYGTIEENNFDIYLNAGENDDPRENDDNAPELPDDYSGGHIVENNATISENNGTIDTNNKKVIQNNEEGLINDNQGTVGQNYGTITENNDTVNENYDEVKTNNANIDYNGEEGSIQKNRGTVESNDDGGLVDINFGSIDENGEDGMIFLNVGYVDQNDGMIGLADGLDTDNLTPEAIDEYVSYGHGNFGEVNQNDGIITLNAGIDDAESADLMPEDKDALDDFQGGSVTTNTNLIIINNGTVETNAKSGLVFENNGTVNKNNGTVTINTETGIVSNYKNGVVETNTGKVYNYGGTIKDKSTGTEYFSVTITSGDNLTQSGGNLETYESKKWLGQKGETKNTTEITITPFENYYINDINIPDSMKNYVSVTHHQNGTWTIKVTSGMNIALSLPKAIFENKGRDPSDDTGSSSSSGNDNSGNGNFGNGNTLVPGNDIQGNPPQVKDNLGNVLNVDLSLILTPLKDKTTALNNFNSPVSMDNIQGFGMVDLSKLFAASTGTTISVPVAANVLKGSSYTICFSDGTEMIVQCNADGQLVIPFVRETQSLANLTFIIYGTALTPPTGTQQSDTGLGPSGGPTAGGQSGSKEGPVTNEQNSSPNGPNSQAGPALVNNMGAYTGTVTSNFGREANYLSGNSVSTSLYRPYDPVQNTTSGGLSELSNAANEIKSEINDLSSSVTGGGVSLNNQGQVTRAGSSTNVYTSGSMLNGDNYNEFTSDIGTNSISSLSDNDDLYQRELSSVFGIDVAPGRFIGSAGTGINTSSGGYQLINNTISKSN